MANRNATKEEKQFLKDMTEYVNDAGVGELYDGYDQRADIQRHHVLGKSAKHNKVHIGYWFVLPIPIELHDVHSNHPLNVTHNKRAFVTEFGKQSDLFVTITQLMAMNGYETPEQYIVDAIIDTGV